MRTAITLAIHRGGELVEMLEGPQTSIDVQRANFKQARQSKTHPQFERIEMWESGAGRVLHHNYREPEVEKVPQVEAPPSSPTQAEVPAEQSQDPAPEPPPVEEVEESGEESQGDFEVSRKPRKRK